MANTSTRRRRFTAPDIRVIWPAEFRRWMVSIDPPEIPELWRRRFEGDQAATLALFNFYAPLAQIVPFMMKARYPDFYKEPVEDLIGDGAIGLWWAIENANPRYPVPTFRKILKRAIRKTIFREVLKRTGTSHRQSDKHGIIARHRARFIQEHGRTPDRHELMETLAGEFNNPQLALDCRPPVLALACSADPKLACRQMERAISREPAPDAKAIDAETRRLALRGLRGTDRQMFSMLMRGESIADIAAVENLKPDQVRRRLNGLLWQARSRADLARYADREPVQRPARSPRTRGSRLIAEGISRVAWRGGANLPPQVAQLGLSSLPTQTLRRDARTDAEIVDLLKAGYSQRAIVSATQGKTATVKARVSALQRALVSQLRGPAAAALAG